MGAPTGWRKTRGELTAGFLALLFQTKRQYEIPDLQIALVADIDTTAISRWRWRGTARIDLESALRLGQAYPEIGEWLRERLSEPVETDYVFRGGVFSKRKPGTKPFGWWYI